MQIIVASQMRAARGALDISQIDLARRAKVGESTIKRFEGGHGGMRAHTLELTTAALEAAGVVFVASDAAYGPGVRLRHGARW